MEGANSDNKKLSDDIRDTLEEIKEGGRKIHDIDRKCKETEKEKQFLTTSLEETENVLIATENNLKRLQHEKGDTEANSTLTMESMDKAFDITKENHNAIMKSVKAQIETLCKEKAELMRSKVALDNKIVEAEDALNHASGRHHELELNIMKVMRTINELQSKLDSEQILKEEAAMDLTEVGRKVNTLTNSLEEAKGMLEQVDRSRRYLEQELMDTTELNHDLTTTHTSLVQEKQRLSLEIQNLTVIFVIFQTNVTNL